jgi:hypothetical protein
MIFSGLTICKIALSDQSDFPAIFCLRKMTYWKFINSLYKGNSSIPEYDNRCHLAPLDGFPQLNFRKSTFRN